VGKVAEAHDFFHSMQTVFGISPVMAQYACMVSVLSRAGMLKDALELVNKMPVEPNARVGKPCLVEQQQQQLLILSSVGLCLIDSS
jgi:pentatricopeptide repeat protein